MGVANDSDAALRVEEAVAEGEEAEDDGLGDEGVVFADGARGGDERVAVIGVEIPCFGTGRIDVGVVEGEFNGGLCVVENDPACGGGGVIDAWVEHILMRAIVGRQFNAKMEGEGEGVANNGHGGLGAGGGGAGKMMIDVLGGKLADVFSVEDLEEFFVACVGGVSPVVVVAGHVEAVAGGGKLKKAFALDAPGFEPIFVE